MATITIHITTQITKTLIYGIKLVNKNIIFNILTKNVYMY